MAVIDCGHWSVSGRYRPIVRCCPTRWCASTSPRARTASRAAAADELPDEAFLPRPYAATFDSAGGRDVHAYVYAPRNPSVVAPDGELPPYIVFVHGGPTGSLTPSLRLEYACFTSRGYGARRCRLRRLVRIWPGVSRAVARAVGVVDVEDCAAAAFCVGEGRRGPTSTDWRFAV